MSIATREHYTSECSPRNGRAISSFIVHHAATTSLDNLLADFAPGGRQVSANYAIKDNEIVATVREDMRAWTSASEFYDGRAITVEVCNSVAADPWPVSEESFQSLARLIADVATRYKFPINDDTVLTHQELYQRFGASYPTACPGDLQRRKGELITLAKTYGRFTSVDSETDGFGNMEAYMLDDHGTVHHILNGKAYKFTSVDDYTAWKQIVDKMRKNKATNLISPPPIKSIVTFASWRVKAVIDRLS